MTRASKFIEEMEPVELAVEKYGCSEAHHELMGLKSKMENIMDPEHKDSMYPSSQEDMQKMQGVCDMVNQACEILPEITETDDDSQYVPFVTSADSAPAGMAEESEDDSTATLHFVKLCNKIGSKSAADKAEIFYQLACGLADELAKKPTGDKTLIAVYKEFKARIDNGEFKK
jgi:hypothetical protein